MNFEASFLNDLNGIKELLEKQMRLTNFSLEVFSISKPRMSGDYLVIHIFETEETNSVQSESLQRKRELAYESEDEEVEEEDTPPKRGGRSRKKVEEEEESGEKRGRK